MFLLISHTAGVSQLLSSPPTQPQPSFSTDLDGGLPGLPGLGRRGVGRRWEVRGQPGEVAARARPVRERGLRVSSGGGGAQVGHCNRNHSQSD